MLTLEKIAEILDVPTSFVDQELSNSIGEIAREWNTPVSEATRTLNIIVELTNFVGKTFEWPDEKATPVLFMLANEIDVTELKPDEFVEQVMRLGEEYDRMATTASNDE